MFTHFLTFFFDFFPQSDAHLCGKEELRVECSAKGGQVN